MRSLWRSCVLGILCAAAAALASSSGVQLRASSSTVRVNASSDISCSAIKSKPVGVYLKRSFHNRTLVLYLLLSDSGIVKNTTANEFRGRLLVTPQGQGFRMRLSQLGTGDTDLYYCQWTFKDKKAGEVRTEISDANLIIVNEGYAEQQCGGRTIDFILVAVSVAALIALILVIVVVMARHRKVKRHFRPQRSWHDPLQPVPPRQRLEHHPYLVTALRAQNSTAFV